MQSKSIDPLIWSWQKQFPCLKHAWNISDLFFSTHIDHFPFRVEWNHRWKRSKLCKESEFTVSSIYFSIFFTKKYLRTLCSFSLSSKRSRLSSLSPSFPVSASLSLLAAWMKESVEAIWSSRFCNGRSGRAGMKDHRLPPPHTHTLRQHS